MDTERAREHSPTRVTVVLGAAVVLGWILRTPRFRGRDCRAPSGPAAGAGVGDRRQWTGETRNLAPQVVPEQVQEAVDTARSWWAVHLPLTDIAPPPLSEEALQPLRTLGHIQ